MAISTRALCVSSRSRPGIATIKQAFSDHLRRLKHVIKSIATPPDYVMGPIRVEMPQHSSFF